MWFLTIKEDGKINLRPNVTLAQVLKGVIIRIQRAGVQKTKVGAGRTAVISVFKCEFVPDYWSVLFTGIL
jgi:hypothetical protein